MFAFVTIVTLAIVCFTCQSYAQGVSYAPLSLFNTGSGEISPLQDGQLLVVGQTYDMQGIPDSGFAFSSWQTVNVFTFTQMQVDSSGNPLPPLISIVPSPVPDYSYQPVLEFTMQPVVLLTPPNNPDNIITDGIGYQVNFIAVPEPSSLALILCGFTAIQFHFGRRFRENNLPQKA